MAFWTDASQFVRDPKRNFRFLLTVPAINHSWAVKKVDKPKFTIGESKHVFLNHTFYYPTKVDWETITVSLVDPIDPYDTTLGVVQWLSTAGYRIPSQGTNNVPYTVTKSKAVFNNTEHKYRKPGNHVVPGHGNFIIKQIDGEGNSVDEWTLYNAWIKDAKFGENSYDSEDMLTVDLTIRYDFANYEHKMRALKQKWQNKGDPHMNGTLKSNPNN